MNPFLLISCIIIPLTASASGKRGNTIPGKLYFSTQPYTKDNAGSKTSFTSGGYIYGRMELNSSIKEAFKFRDPDMQNPFPYLMYEISVWKNGELSGSKNSLNFILLKDGDQNKTAINFDVLPDPSQNTTIFSLLEDFSYGYGFNPMYEMINEDNFPSAGQYSIKVRFYYRSTNSWGKEEEMEKWPDFEGSFDFAFNESDIARLQKNKKIITETTKENAFRLEKLPDIFSNPAKPNDPKVTPAKITAILNRDLPNRTIIKYAVENLSGPLWHIAKDDYNLPKYRYFSPDIYVAYK